MICGFSAGWSIWWLRVLRRFPYKQRAVSYVRAFIGKNAQNQQTRRKGKNSSMESDSTMAGVVRGKVNEARVRKTLGRSCPWRESRS